MDGKKDVLKGLIGSMRQKMLDGEGDEEMEVEGATEEPTSPAADRGEDITDILKTEEEELATGEDLDGDGKAGDAGLVAAIKKYMGQKPGSPAPMKGGGMIQTRRNAPPPQFAKKGGKK